MFAFPSLYLRQRNDLERSLLLTIKLIHLILVYWKKNNLAEKIGLLLMKANICPRDPLCQDRRIGCLYKGFLASDGQDCFCLFLLKWRFLEF